MTTAAATRRRSSSGSETRQRGDKIDVRLNDDEGKVIREAAQLAGLKPAAFLRTAALLMAKGALPSAVEPEDRLAS
ncbi:plasmid mobilization protein [Mycolicibacterium septicum]|uniref:Plasmid mobilization protein n=1 Tax=Mycolicibacterium septicum TaxID=98668 RepID=A0ABW9M396_9MYCO